MIRTRSRLARWLRANSERYLMEDAQARMARQYLGRPGPAVERGLVPVLWRRLFVPAYHRLPPRVRQTMMEAMPGSHRRGWRTPPSRSHTPGI
ncbi:MAG TPA: hypothetical protein VMU20_06670 [Candidatus Dormibacteraeota bacterium]|jgi:hypothetical protein|nr:hypothetical protein [Candidatus Dormibacteraeota bacterium]